MSELTSRRDELAQEIVRRHFAAHPDLDARYGARGRAYCLEDAHYHLRYLEQALEIGSVQLFVDYVRWAKIMLERRNIPIEDLVSNLQTMRQVLSGVNGVARIITEAIEGLQSSPPEPQGPHSELARAYLSAVLAGERLVASRLIHDAIEGGISLHEVYLHVFQSAQHEIGRLWQRNQISVADEHLATAITQMIMSQLYPLLFAGPRKERTLVSLCVESELHEIGARMVADFFEMAGWRTYYLGGNVPLRSVLQTISQRNADVAGISVTIPYHVGTAAELIRAIRADASTKRAKVIVGGYPFLVDPELWQRVGADGSANDAQEAVELAERLVSAS